MEGHVHCLIFKVQAAELVVLKCNDIEGKGATVLV